MKTFVRAALVASLLTGTALAQDASMSPTYATLNLNAGFSPDPARVQVQSGGVNDASRVGNGCSGYVASGPDIRINYTAGSLPLTISAVSGADTTLVVNLPNGNWVCNDDGNGTGLNPQLRFERPLSGQYDVWVGTLADNSNHPATVLVSELAGGGLNASTGGQPQVQGLMGNNTGGGANASEIDVSGQPHAGTFNLRAGFQPDPTNVSVTPGGDINASTLGGNCVGNISRAPDVRVNYTAGSLPLVLSVNSTGDTSLVVNLPNGQYACDDDGGNTGLNPALTFNQPQSGQYDIWVGNLGDTYGVPATLSISELYSH